MPWKAIKQFVKEIVIFIIYTLHFSPMGTQSGLHYSPLLHFILIPTLRGRPGWMCVCDWPRSFIKLLWQSRDQTWFHHILVLAPNPLQCVGFTKMCPPMARPHGIQICSVHKDRKRRGKRRYCRKSWKRVRSDWLTWEGRNGFVSSPAHNLSLSSPISGLLPRLLLLGPLTRRLVSRFVWVHFPGCQVQLGPAPG